MSVRVWFEEDIQNVLNAASLSASLLETSGEFRRGYYAALAIAGAAFGLTVPACTPASETRIIEIESPSQGKTFP